MLPPHPAGPLAAMEETPGADVVFVAHTGTEDLISPAIIWRGIPFGRAIRANYWHVDAREIPTTSEERVAWLNTQWQAVDAWISANRVTAIDPGPASRDDDRVCSRRGRPSRGLRGRDAQGARGGRHRG